MINDRGLVIDRWTREVTTKFLQDCVGSSRDDRLPRTQLGQHAALQLARSSTSTFANYGEVQSAESRRDFIHKLGICFKELRETRTWLKFVGKMGFSSPEALDPLLRESDELLAIISTSIKTARRNSLPTQRP